MSNTLKTGEKIAVKPCGHINKRFLLSVMHWLRREPTNEQHAISQLLVGDVIESIGTLPVNFVPTDESDIVYHTLPEDIVVTKGVYLTEAFVNHVCELVQKCYKQRCRPVRGNCENFDCYSTVHWTDFLGWFGQGNV